MSKKKSIDELLNDLSVFVIYNKLKNLALNMFEWEGLPESIKPRYIEQTLYTHGRALFFEDKMLGLLCLQAAPAGGVNVYGEHMRYRAIGFNYNKEYDIVDDPAVLIRNNMLCINTHDFIMLYAARLSDIERSIDVNVKAQKTPYILTCDDKDQFTFKAIFNKIDGNAPAIYADKNINLNSIEVLTTQAPYVADKLSDLEHDIENKVLTALGINNANTDKRERLVNAEVNANNDYVTFNAQYMLEARQEAAEEINKRFGLNVSVKLREVEQVEPVHNGTEGDN